MSNHLIVSMIHPTSPNNQQQIDNKFNYEPIIILECKNTDGAKHRKDKYNAKNGCFINLLSEIYYKKEKLNQTFNQFVHQCQKNYRHK